MQIGCIYKSGVPWINMMTCLSNEKGLCHDINCDSDVTLMEKQVRNSVCQNMKNEIAYSANLMCQYTCTSTWI